MRRTILAGTCLVTGLSAADAGPEPFTPFTVAVSLTPKATAALVRTKARAHVVVYYGFRPPPAIARTIPEGEIPMGRETVDLGTMGGTADFVGRGFQPGKVKPTLPGERVLLVNVHSSEGARLNALDCPSFEGPLKVASARPIAIACKAIGED